MSCSFQELTISFLFFSKWRGVNYLHITLVWFNSFKKSVVVRIKEKIAIVFSHTKVIALPKHNNKYYKIRYSSVRTQNCIQELCFNFQEDFQLYDNQLLQFSISVSSYSSCTHLYLLFSHFTPSLKKKRKNVYQIVFSSSLLYFPFIFFFFSFN